MPELQSFESAVLFAACNCYITSRPTTTATVWTTMNVTSVDIMFALTTRSFISSIETDVSVIVKTQTSTTTSPDVTSSTTFITTLQASTVTVSAVSVNASSVTAFVPFPGVSMEIFFGPERGCRIFYAPIVQSDGILFSSVFSPAFTLNLAIQRCAMECVNITPRGKCGFFYVISIVLGGSGLWACHGQATLPDQSFTPTSRSWLSCETTQQNVKSAGYIITYS